MNGPASIPVLVLCGGRGERLRSVATRPKPLIEVGGRPFVTYALERMHAAGLRRIIFLSGYQAEQFPVLLEGDALRLALPFLAELELRFLPETGPLGTAGALRRALPEIPERALVQNGDTYFDLDYAAFLAFHLRGSSAGSLASTFVENAADFGTLAIDDRDLVTQFREKAAAGSGWINGGVYVLERSLFETAIPAGPASLERDVLPALSARGQLRAFRSRGLFCDIGTVERLERARHTFPLNRPPGG